MPYLPKIGLPVSPRRGRFDLFFLPVPFGEVKKRGEGGVNVCNGDPGLMYRPTFEWPE